MKAKNCSMFYYAKTSVKISGGDVQWCLKKLKLTILTETVTDWTVEKTFALFYELDNIFRNPQCALSEKNQFIENL